MILLDDDTMLLKESYTTEGVYHCDNREGCKNINKIILDGVELKYVKACDVNRGMVIVTKMRKDGGAVVENDHFVYELRYGKVEVTFK